MKRLLLALCALSFAGADWPTHRGNAQRTGNVDGQPGPASPKVLWVHRGTEHFIAAPVGGTKSVFVSGLGAFNTSSFLALSTAPDAKDRVAWMKSAPYLKLPLVSAPAVAGGLVVFGDGMHQTDGAILHALNEETGRAAWQLSVPGQLVHLEGGPVIAGGKVFIGGGNAGVLCIDPSQVTLEGKQIDMATAKKTLDERWKVLVAKYEQDKKVDPDFAIPPSEDALPKPSPKLAWEQGKNKWHVDAPLAVAGDRVLVASAHLDMERVGERALFCLSAADGKTLWQTPLKHNPWGGPTVAGDVVLVGCSSIRFETKDIPKAQGELVALSLADGMPRWNQAFPAGGVISTVAAVDGLAVFTSTDGKVRGREISTGRNKWVYDAKAPFFAGPAVVGGVAYAADLAGNVHAIGVADGKPRWTFDLSQAPVAAPGMVYASPIVHGGRLYVATCNLESETRKQTVVVCFGEK